MSHHEEADRLNQFVGEAVETAQLDAGLKLNLKPHAIEAIIDTTREECRTLLGLLPRISAGLMICKSSARMERQNE